MKKTKIPASFDISKTVANNKNMKKILALTFIILSLTLLVGCNMKDSTQNTSTYESISADEAKEYMDNNNGYIILDVRTPEEYSGGHIKGAINIPDYEIASRAEKELKDKSQTILVYCRSGNRSKKASASLAEMGYTNILEFGGITDWKYETE